MNFQDLPQDKQLAEMARMVQCTTGLITEEVSARVLDVEPSTLATWRSQGKGPDYVKLGKGVFYTVNSLSAWVNGEMARQRDTRKRAA